MSNIIKKTHILPWIIIILASASSFSYDSFQRKNHNKNIRMQTKHEPKYPFSLRFLYTNFIGKIMRKAITNKWFSSLAGYYCDTKLSKCHIPAFIEEHAIDISQAEKSLTEFTTFNDFFIRKLKPGARPLQGDATTIISPADGHVIAFENSTKITRFPIKQSIFNLEQFLCSKKLADFYEGGTLLIFRLAPYDYHRFHFPLDCIPSKANTIHGKYESVNPLVYRTGIQPLTENERHLSLLTTDHCGTIALVSVGALCVGKIIETYIPYHAYSKGAEAGYFCFGGSTIVLIFPKGVIQINPEILKNSEHGNETPIKMGQKIATITAYPEASEN